MLSQNLTYMKSETRQYPAIMGMIGNTKLESVAANGVI